MDPLGEEVAASTPDLLTYILDVKLSHDPQAMSLGRVRSPCSFMSLSFTNACFASKCWAMAKLSASETSV